MENNTHNGPLDKNVNDRNRQLKKPKRNKSWANFKTWSQSSHGYRRGYLRTKDSPWIGNICVKPTERAAALTRTGLDALNTVNRTLLVTLTRTTWPRRTSTRNHEDLLGPCSGVQDLATAFPICADKIHTILDRLTAKRLPSHSASSTERRGSSRRLDPVSGRRKKFTEMGVTARRASRCTHDPSSPSRSWRRDRLSTPAKRQSQQLPRSRHPSLSARNTRWAKSTAPQVRMCCHFPHLWVTSNRVQSFSWEPANAAPRLGRKQTSAWLGKVWDWDWKSEVWNQGFGQQIEWLRSKRGAAPLTPFPPKSNLPSGSEFCRPTFLMNSLLPLRSPENNKYPQTFTGTSLPSLSCFQTSQPKQFSSCCGLVKLFMTSISPCAPGPVLFAVSSEHLQAGQNDWTYGSVGKATSSVLLHETPDRLRSFLLRHGQGTIVRSWLQKLWAPPHRKRRYAWAVYWDMQK